MLDIINMNLHYHRCFRFLSILYGSHSGKALTLALAQKGVFVTIIDYSEDRGNEVASLAEKENAKFHSKLDFPSAVFIKCDVTKGGKFNTSYYPSVNIC